MKKSGTNALWNDLSPSQLDKLDHWLFEEGLSCQDILPRSQAELGFKGSLASLKRYYARRLTERTVLEFKDLQHELAEISSAPADAASLRSASMKLLAKYVFHQVRHAPDKVKEWVAVANLIAQNDYNDLLRQTKAEELSIRRATLAFAREKFNFAAFDRALTTVEETIQLWMENNPGSDLYTELGIEPPVFGPDGLVVGDRRKLQEFMNAFSKRLNEEAKERHAQALRERQQATSASAPNDAQPTSGPDDES